MSALRGSYAAAGITSGDGVSIAGRQRHRGSRALCRTRRALLLDILRQRFRIEKDKPMAHLKGPAKNEVLDDLMKSVSTLRALALEHPPTSVTEG